MSKHDDEREALKKDFGYDIFSAGEFKVGDKVKIRHTGAMKKKGGAIGRIVRIDNDGGTFPIIVWLAEFGRPTGMEEQGKMGLPVCADEIRSCL